MAENFQRIGSRSNSHVGRDFERKAMKKFRSLGIEVERDFAVEVGISLKKKVRRFDLGFETPAILVE